jgi:NitT/TauT family transport system substrate-binding protein
VEASIEGWKSYLADPAAGNTLIKKSNPDMPQDLLDYAVKVMRENGIVDGGDAVTLGIGAMTDARWKALFDLAAGAGVYKTDTDVRKAYTTEFVNHKYGLAP